MPVAPREANEIIDRIRKGETMQMTRNGLAPRCKQSPLNGDDFGHERRGDPEPVTLTIPKHDWGCRRWYETEAGIHRLVEEKKAVQAIFPTFEPEVDGDGNLRWVGTMSPPNNPEQDYIVVLTCRNGYLTGTVPEATIIDPPIKQGAPHRFNTLDLCYEHNNFGPTTPITHCLGWVFMWITLYQNWLLTGVRW